LDTSSPGAVTELLRAWGGGDDGALEQLTPLVEAELRRLARGYMRRDRRDHTLQATALVNEAFLRLTDARRVRWQDRAHFLGISARLMRRVLVDHARSRGYYKRGGGAQRVTLDDEVDFVILGEEEYARLTGQPAAVSPAAEQEGEKHRPPNRPGQQSASAGATDERTWVWEWDEETQSWALPWARDADPAEYPGLAFLTLLQNSPLADAFRDGDFTPEEWDAACRIGR
jgi:hypothetical protein